MNLREHAEKELQLLGYDLNQTEEDPNKWVVENILELVDVFSKQGHSGSSAPYCIKLFSLLANWKPITPLTGNDDEWNSVGNGLGFLYQNNRCSEVFKDSSGAYNVNGKVFRDKNGVCYTNKNSRVYIKFPYTPRDPEIIELEFEEEIDTNSSDCKHSKEDGNKV